MGAGAPGAWGSGPGVGCGFGGKVGGSGGGPEGGIPCSPLSSSPAKTKFDMCTSMPGLEPRVACGRYFRICPASVK